MALKGRDAREDPAAIKAGEIFQRMGEEKKRERSAAEADKKPMKPVSFLISEEDYESLKAVSSDLGLGIGSGIRFAIRDFLKRQGAK